MLTQMIQVNWKNDCGETLFVQKVALSDVLEMIYADDRSEYNSYILPDGHEVTESELLEWAGVTARVSVAVGMLV